MNSGPTRLHNILATTVARCARTHHTAGCLALLLLVISVSDARSDAREPEHTERREIAEFFSTPFNALLRLYQSALRQARPAICQMYPSDSSYARQAVKKYGPGKGILMASDRLQRCGNDLKHYEPVIIDGKPYYSDPLP